MESLNIREFHQGIKNTQ